MQMRLRTPYVFFFAFSGCCRESKGGLVALACCLGRQGGGSRRGRQAGTYEEGLTVFLRKSTGAIRVKLAVPLCGTCGQLLLARQDLSSKNVARTARSLGDRSIDGCVFPAGQGGLGKRCGTGVGGGKFEGQVSQAVHKVWRRLQQRRPRNRPSNFSPNSHHCARY